MPQSQRLSSVIPFVAIDRPACPKCKAPMMLASIELARPGVDLHTFECAICNHVLKTFAAYESRGRIAHKLGNIHHWTTLIDARATAGAGALSRKRSKSDV
jgi:hypothetical protein